VCTRPADNFYAEIRAAGYHMSIGTFETAHKATRSYDMLAWRLGYPRRNLNFHSDNSATQVKMLVPHHALSPMGRAVLAPARHC
jgi:hypothetical protein